VKVRRWDTEGPGADLPTRGTLLWRSRLTTHFNLQQMESLTARQSGLEILNTIRYSSPLLIPFCGTEMVTITSVRATIEISISYNQNAFDALILSITRSTASNGYKVC